MSMKQQSNTFSKKSGAFKAAVGFMFIIACGDVAPPEAAKNITPEQQQIIEADLDRAELQSGFVKKLADRADPLLDFKGKTHENNDHM